MQFQNRLRHRLVLQSVALALLSVLMAIPTVRVTESGSVSNRNASLARQVRPTLKAKSPGTMFSAPSQIALAEELALVFEDSDEMLRGDLQQRQTFGIEEGTRRRDLLSKIAPTPRAIISPPLLV